MRRALFLAIPLACLSAACTYDNGDARRVLDPTPTCTDGAATPVQTWIDVNQQIVSEPGKGAGVFIEYAAGGHWSIRTTCDFEKSNTPCAWDIIVTPEDDRSISNVKPGGSGSRHGLRTALPGLPAQHSTACGDHGRSRRRYLRYRAPVCDPSRRLARWRVRLALLLLGRGRRGPHRLSLESARARAHARVGAHSDAEGCAGRDGERDHQNKNVCCQTLVKNSPLVFRASLALALFHVTTAELVEARAVCRALGSWSVGPRLLRLSRARSRARSMKRGLAAQQRVVLGFDALINSVRAEQPALGVVGAHRAQHFFHHALLQAFVQDREHDLDPAPEVARHPIGAGAKDFVLPAIFELKNPRVFEIAIDHGRAPGCSR